MECILDTLAWRMASFPPPASFLYSCLGQRGRWEYMPLHGLPAAFREPFKMLFPGPSLRDSDTKVADVVTDTCQIVLRGVGAACIGIHR